MSVAFPLNRPFNFVRKTSGKIKTINARTKRSALLQKKKVLRYNFHLVHASGGRLTKATAEIASKSLGFAFTFDALRPLCQNDPSKLEATARNGNEQ